jgi:hypothetical protein
MEVRRLEDLLDGKAKIEVMGHQVTLDLGQTYVDLFELAQWVDRNHALIENLKWEHLPGYPAYTVKRDKAMRELKSKALSDEEIEELMK